MLYFQRYIASLAVVLTMLGAYALAVAPWLEPPPPKRRAADSLAGAIAPSLATQQDLRRLFSPGSWELDQPKIIESDGCTLLVKDYQPLPDGKLKLTPCTLIFYAKATGGAKERRAIVLQAPQGAVVQFDRALDLTRGQFGKLAGGRMPGEITIFSPETSVGAGDALHLTTRNLQIDKQRVFTPHDVEFTYGDSHGRGRDLTIALLPKVPEDPESGIGGVRSLTLAHIDHLHLETKAEAPLPGFAAAKSAGRMAAPPAPLEVTCQGPFVFDMTSQTAMFDDGVQVLRVNPAGPPDKLLCRQLLLAFADEDNAPSSPQASNLTSAVTRRKNAAGSDPLSGRLKRVVAIGSPATLEAPSSASRISAAEIEYSLVKRRLILRPGAQVAQVALFQEQSQFTARMLEYEMSEPGRLGRMWAAGPGRLLFSPAQTERPPQTAEPRPKVAARGESRRMVAAMRSRGAPLGGAAIEARWTRHLRVGPDGKNQVISLVGDAFIAAGDLGQFTAEELHFWVREEEVGNREPGVGSQESGISSEAGDRGQGTGDTARRFSILPDRLLATGSVVLDSPRLHAATARLEAWFLNQPASPQPQPLPPISPISPAAHQTAELGPARPEPEPLQPPSQQKFDLAGDLIQMQMLRQGSEMNLDNLTIARNVVLAESRTPESGQKAIRITGDRLELRGGASGPGKIDVIGEPAEVGGRGLSLAGGEIHLVRAENRLWIDGPGKAMLPAAGLASGMRQLPDGAASPQNAAPSEGLRLPLAEQRFPLAGEVHVVWQEGLTFDGLTAAMNGDVQARTATQLATCPVLEVSLDRRLDFSAPDGRQQPDMARLSMDGGVVLISRGLNDRGEQESLERMELKDLVIDRSAGTLHASGPGWMTSTRLPGAALLGASLPGTLPAARPMAPDSSGSPLFNHVRIDFEGDVVGDLAKHEIQFQRQVRTVFIPVGDWEERIDIQRLEDLGDKGVLMTSQRLTVTEMAPAGQPRWLEASATGGVIVDGKNFKVSAPRIAYTSDKQVLTLEGDGRADAQLWYQTAPGQPFSTGAARKWRYWLQSGLFDVEDARPFEFQLNGIDKIRLPGRR